MVAAVVAVPGYRRSRNMADAFRVMAIETPQDTRSLRGKLAKRQDDLVEAIGSGIATDYADYKARCGVIKGLDEAIAILDDMIKQESK